MDLNIEHLNPPQLDILDLDGIEGQLSLFPKEPYVTVDELLDVVRTTRHLERQFLFTHAFSRLEQCRTLDDGERLIRQFEACGTNFDEIIISDWYKMPKKESLLGNPEDAQSALSGVPEGSFKSFKHRVKRANENSKKACIAFTDFNLAYCIEKDKASWKKCVGLFDDGTVVAELTALMGGEERYARCFRIFRRYLQVAIGSKYITALSSNLDEVGQVHCLIQALVRLIAPADAVVERWDNACLLVRDVLTSAGEITISGFPDLAYFNAPPAPDSEYIITTRNMIHELEEEFEASTIGPEAVSAEPKAKKAKPGKARRDPEVVREMLQTHQNIIRINYVPRVTYSIEGKLPCIRHAAPGRKVSTSLINAACKHQISGQLMARQHYLGFDQPVYGLLTDGFSGTIVLLRAKTKRNAPHEFIRLPAAADVRVLYHYMLLISYRSPEQVEAMFSWRIMNTGGAAAPGSAGGSGSPGADQAYVGSRSSGAFRTAGGTVGRSADVGFNNVATSSKHARSCGSSGDAEEHESGSSAYSAGMVAQGTAVQTPVRQQVNDGSKYPHFGSWFTACAHIITGSADCMSDLSSEPGSECADSDWKDGSDWVDPSVWETEDGFDSEAEFEYYNDPARALRILKAQLGID